MKSKLIALALSAGCGAALAITLSVGAAEQPRTSSVATPVAATSETAATPPQQYTEYRNDQWHFSITVPSNITAEKTDDRGGTTIQFLEPTGNILFQVSAWPYQDLDVALGEVAPAGTASDQGSTLGIVGVVHNDTVEYLFRKDGITYDVETLPQDATSTLDILKSWQFI